MTSPRHLSRRQALAALGTVSLGGVLAACGGDGDGDEPRTSTPRSSPERFDASASCKLTPEQAEGPYYFDVDSLRTAHIHAKVHLDKRTLLTTQLYFEDSVSDAVYARAPYADRGRREVTNENDGIFDATTVLSLSKEDGGYLGLLTIGVERA